MPRLGAPILLLHSREDELIPLHHAQRLAQAATAPVRIVELRGGHNDAFIASAQAYRAALAEFLAAMPGS